MPELALWWRDERGEWVCQEALLDVVVTWPGGWLPRRLVDVRVRDPEAARCQPAAAARAGAAAAKAAGEKCVQYRPHNGVSVATFACAPLGRVGEAGLQLLDGLAADAAEAGGDRTAAAGLRRRWRHALEHALLSGVADALLGAAGQAGALAW